MAFDLDKEREEFRLRKAAAHQRNQDYWLARQALEHIYLWPRNFPPFKDKVILPLVRKSVLTHANFLMGRGFTTQIQPLGPNQSDREAAQRAEKALFLAIDRCSGWRSMWRAAMLGSLLGTSGFKVYKDGDGKACFCAIQPEFLYAVPRGDEYTDAVKVYYAYSVDRLEAERQWGRRDYKSERQVSQMEQGDRLDRTYQIAGPALEDRRIPVMEVWTRDDYALWVGGESIANGPNPYKFIPYVVIQNIDSLSRIEGLSDVDALLGLRNDNNGLNVQLNVLLSESYYIAKRYANPTISWEAPPPNYMEHIAQMVGGGGVLPRRMGTSIEFLQYQGQPPDLGALIELLRVNGIEVSGLNELAWSGSSQGGVAVQTGPSLEVKFTNVLSTLGSKQQQWAVGLKRLFWMMLALMSGEDEIGVADKPYARKRADRGMRVSGRDVADHRDCKIIWPGFLPKDDMAAARFELEKHGARVQSMATTLENLGFDFPDDELQRIRDETEDEQLPAGTDEQANLMRAKASMVGAEAKAAAGQPELVGDEGVEGDLDLPSQPGDFEELTDTPPGYGSLEDGTVVRDDGSPLGLMEEQLVRQRADQLRRERPLDLTGEEPAEEEELVY